MELNTSAITLSIAVGTLLFNIGYHFGYIRTKFNQYDEDLKELFKHSENKSIHHDEAASKTREELMNFKIDNVQKSLNEFKDTVRTDMRRVETSVAAGLKDLKEEISKIFPR